jgi:murein L,D-transpeptidase YafK
MKTIFALTSVVLAGGMLVNSGNKPATKTVAAAAAKSHKRMFSPNGPVGSVSIVIDKSDYELSVFDSKGWYATYPVVFGNNTLSDKKMEGDKNTPEGTFHIQSKRVHEKWCRFMALDYPTAESRQKFNQWKQNGEIPSSAKIGGSIGIHGTWPHEDFVIDRFKNWTMGCISMKNDDVSEIYSFTTQGTKVTIKK